MPNPEALRVSELAADWRNRVRLIFGQGSTGIAMLKCAAELEAALSEAAPQVDADGIVAAMVESHPMFAEWWNELPETTAQSFMDRLARHIVRDLLTRAAAALPAPGDAVRRELDTLAAYVEEARTAYAGHHSSGTFRVVANRIDKLREALAALPVVRDEGEAVAEVRVTAGYAEAVLLSRIAPDLPHGTKLYTAPPVAQEQAVYFSRAISDRPYKDAGWMTIPADGYMRYPELFDYRIDRLAAAAAERDEP